MYLLVVILDKSTHLERVIDRFVEIGVPGATVIESRGLGRDTLFSTDTPLIASVRRVFDKDLSTFNHTLLSVIDRKETLDAATAAVIEIVEGFEKPDTGIMFTIKVDQVFGFTRVQEESSPI